MFSDALSIAVFHLCHLYHISYRAAAKQCGISPGYYVAIARKRASPSIGVLEKICNAFELTPNDLLLLPDPQKQISLRIPMPVTQIQYYYCGYNGYTTYPICPHCGITLDREYQSYCDRCGQALEWKSFSKATILLPKY